MTVVGIRNGKLVDATGVDLSKHGRWRSADHERGSGRVHLIDPEALEKTVCGHKLQMIGGRAMPADAKVTCLRCPALVVSRKDGEDRRREWDAAAAKQQQAEATARAERTARYHAYLKSPEWRAKRLMVLERAKHLCEGCLERRATQVHHETYEHAGHEFTGGEFLWELRAICDACHERLHAEKH